MKYDFSKVIDRKGHDAISADTQCFPGVLVDAKVKEGFSIIPMWIADMSFATCPAITDSIVKRVSHPLFGYFHPREEYYSAIIDWQTRNNGVVGLTKECIGYENGVLGGLVSAMNVFSSKGANVLLHSPTYVGFTGTLNNNGYNIILSELVPDSDGVLRMDFDDMERKIVNNQIHAAVFCSPHNPSGRVWERWEIEKAMELFKKHDVYVVSDEIWSDLTLFANKHIPTQSVSEDARNRTVALYAPSKTFNLAGLVGSYHIIYNKYLRERIRKEASLCHYNEMNVLSMHALIGAYTEEGREWLSEAKQVIEANVNFACRYISEHFDGVKVSTPQGTYMLFLDCSEWCKKNNVSVEELQRRGMEVGVIWQDGRAFHGSCHIRMNLAIPMVLVREALDRLDKYAFNLK